MVSRLGISTALLALPVLTPAAPPGFQALLDNSPFDPVKAAPQAPEGPVPELRAVLREGAEFYFNVFDPATGQSSWTRLGGTARSWTVRDYDEERGRATLQQSGQTVVVSLNPLAAPTPTAAAEPTSPGDHRVDREPRRTQSASAEGSPRLARQLVQVRQRRLQRAASTVATPAPVVSGR
jgi:hypothetical protein